MLLKPGSPAQRFRETGPPCQGSWKPGWPWQGIWQRELGTVETLGAFDTVMPHVGGSFKEIIQNMGRVVA